jgi:uncharacterized protein (TIGR00251 family)
VILRVRVIPRASKPGIAVEADGSLKVHLKSPPVEGAANAELIELLANVLGVPRRAVTIAGGAHARTKRVEVEGIDERRAAVVLAGSTSAAAERSRPPRRRPRR